MQKLSKTTALLLGLTALIFIVAVPQKVSAQFDSIGIASYLPINNAKVENGDIVVSSAKGYSLSNRVYDSNIVGVISTSPAISIKTTGQKNGFPVITSGTGHVKVTGEGGPIKKGDFIATSSTTGAGMKAADSGFIIGTSLTDATFAKKGDVQYVEVIINPHFPQAGTDLTSSLLDIFNLSKVAAFEKPSKTLQYLAAALITIASFGAGFLIFAKTVNTGLEALGRNPLAGRMIQVSIVLNVILIAVIVIAGIALAYLVLRL